MRLLAMIGSEHDVWDAEDLALPQRIASAIDVLGASALSDALAGNPPQSISRSVVAALLRRRKAKDLPAFSPEHDEILMAVALEAPGMLSSGAAWRGIGIESARSLLLLWETPPPGVVYGALKGGHEQAVADVVGVDHALEELASMGSFKLVRRILSDAGWVPGNREPAPRVLLLMAAVGEDANNPQLLASLEEERSRVDELWLRAAVAALASRAFDPGTILQTVFGPLHAAITADRLPRDCWTVLDRVLPDAPDPALRLRRYLLKFATGENWEPDELSRALREAGPYAHELLSEFDENDEWWISIAKAMLRALGLFGR
jgi:hypothetical protein